MDWRTDPTLSCRRRWALAWSVLAAMRGWLITCALIGAVLGVWVGLSVLG